MFLKFTQVSVIVRPKILSMYRLAGEKLRIKITKRLDVLCLSSIFVGQTNSIL